MTRDYFRGTLRERLEHYTEIDPETGCWLWTGTLRKGYGLVWCGPELGQREAHIVTWELENDEAANGRVVRHTCDNPPCRRPDHLVIGTHADNVKDKVERGRQDKGSKHGMSKVTEDDVRQIRMLSDYTRLSQSAIAQFFGLNQANVSLIVTRRAWKHVP